MNIRRLCLAALPIAATLAVGAGAAPAAALGGCTLLPGTNYTSVHCTTSGGAPFVHAEQTCVLNYYTWVAQIGPSVGQNGYSSAGPCTSLITGRHMVQTTFP